MDQFVMTCLKDAIQVHEVFAGVVQHLPVRRITRYLRIRLHEKYRGTATKWLNVNSVLRNERNDMMRHALLTAVVGNQGLHLYLTHR
jgi:hypothetical protein